MLVVKVLIPNASGPLYLPFRTMPEIDDVIAIGETLYQVARIEPRDRALAHPDDPDASIDAIMDMTPPTSLDEKPDVDAAFDTSDEPDPPMDKDPESE